MRVVKAFSDDEYEIGISNVARRLALPKSTVHRLASTLVDAEFLEKSTAAAYDYATAASCRLFGDVACTTSGLYGRQISLGAAYYFSRRAHVFPLYAKLWNGRSAQYNNVDGVDVPSGADPQQLALGITHDF